MVFGFVGIIRSGSITLANFRPNLGNLVLINQAYQNFVRESDKFSQWQVIKSGWSSIVDLPTKHLLLADSPMVKMTIGEWSFHL
jgi:hypothetical protein